MGRQWRVPDVKRRKKVIERAEKRWHIIKRGKAGKEEKKILTMNSCLMGDLKI